MKYLSLALVALVALLIGPHIYRSYRTEKKIRQQIADSVRVNAASGQAAKIRPGQVHPGGAFRPFTEKDLHRLIEHNPKAIGRVAIWKWEKTRVATVSAMGIDRRHHFANSYLVGYQPFETKQVWVPLYTLALRKQYEYDHLQYSGLKDVWQNSRQGYLYPKGDCEDHAIILADWLIEMGIDARVVLGSYKKTGHAWVVFILNEKAYLLEATSKERVRSMRGIPAAALKVDYHPAYQFNRDSFWVNTGSRLTTSYTGRRWELRSRFIEVPAKSRNNPENRS